MPRESDAKKLERYKVALDQNLQELVQRNVISSAEARGKAANKDNFAG